MSLSEEETHWPVSYTFDEIFSTVMGAIGGIVGEDYLADLTVVYSTRFEADLELESIEIVQLAEELIAHYGEQVDFVNWFASMELDDLIELSVGRLTDFILASLEADRV